LFTSEYRPLAYNDNYFLGSPNFSFLSPKATSEQRPPLNNAHNFGLPRVVTWASAGEGKRRLLPPPPWPGIIVCFLTINEKNSMFLPPWKILPSPGKKSADAHGWSLNTDLTAPKMFLYKGSFMPSRILILGT